MATVWRHGDCRLQRRCRVCHTLLVLLTTSISPKKNFRENTTRRREDIGAMLSKRDSLMLSMCGSCFIFPRLQSLWLKNSCANCTLRKLRSKSSIDGHEKLHPCNCPNVIFTFDSSDAIGKSGRHGQQWPLSLRLGPIRCAEGNAMRER